MAKEKETMAKRGRKTRYEDDFPERVIEMAERGCIEKQMAHNLGISTESFYKYKRTIPEFAQALKEGKRVADQKVESALYRRARGYEYEERHEELIRRPVHAGTGRGAKIRMTTERKMKRITKKVAPDTLACIFWLKNRKPGDWRDKHEHQHSGEVNILLDSRFAKV